MMLRQDRPDLDPKTGLIGLGDRLLLKRQWRGLTQEQLAKLTGISSPAQSHFENNNRLPTVKNLAKLCRALKCSADYLLGL